MAPERPELKLLQPGEAPAPAADAEVEERSGCMAVWGAVGMAAYASIVLVMFFLGVLGTLGSIVGLVISSYGDEAVLASGVEVDAWRIQELRRSGVLREGQSPSVYHDHSRKMDGSAGCLVIGDELVRWEGWARQSAVTIHGASLALSGAETAPTITLSTPASSVTCPFEEGQGGEKLVRMLRAEIEAAR